MEQTAVEHEDSRVKTSPMPKHRNPNQALSHAIIMCNSKKQTMGGFVSSTKPLRLYDGSSEPLKSSGLGKAHPEYATLVKLMLPVYYVPDPLTDEQLTLATTVWKAVLNSEAPRYQKQCRDDSFASEYPTALEFFTVTFFRRLFDIHPIFVTALSKVKDREHFMRLAIDFILSAESDQKVFELALERFAHVHHVRGVRAAECEFTTLICAPSNPQQMASSEKCCCTPSSRLWASSPSPRTSTTPGPPPTPAC